MSNKTEWTRRQMASALLAASPAAAAQSVPAYASAEVTEARESVKQNRDSLRKVRVPIAVEPSFAFRP